MHPATMQAIAVERGRDLHRDAAAAQRARQARRIQPLQQARPVVPIAPVQRTRRDLKPERLSQGPASVSGPGRPSAMSLAAVVQHVQVLQAIDLVWSQKAGRTRTCSISPAALGSAANWIAERRSLWQRRLDRLGDYLADAATSGPPPAR